MSDLESDELNRQLCAVVTEELFESWPPEVQQQVLAEWNHWQEEKPGNDLLATDKSRYFAQSRPIIAYYRLIMPIITWHPLIVLMLLGSGQGCLITWLWFMIIYPHLYL